jgi:type I restriction enzyme, S subunit
MKKSVSNSKRWDMGSKWIEKKWGELATLEYGKALRGYEQSSGKYCVYGTNGSIGWTDSYLYDKPSVIIGRKGAYRGVHFAENPFFVIDTAFYLKPKVKFDMHWAYYQLLTQNINAMDSGSAIPSTSREDFYGLSLLFPPIDEQVAIAQLLGTLEQKICLNQRMNHTLESIAQALFKSWFVDFEPVKAKAEGRKLEGIDDAIAALFPSSFIESPLSLIPHGWRIGDIKDLCQKVESGGTPSRKERTYWDNGTIPWLTSREVRQKVILDTEEKITERGLAESNAKIWPSMSTVVAMYGATAGQVTLLANSVSANQACCALIPKPYTQSFVFLKAARSVEIYERQARGSAQQNLNKSIVSELKTIIPSQKILEAFENVVGSLIVFIIQGVKENMTLSELRDHLLPRLISGKLRVEEVSETVEALAL